MVAAGIKNGQISPVIMIQVRRHGIQQRDLCQTLREIFHRDESFRIQRLLLRVGAQVNQSLNRRRSVAGKVFTDSPAVGCAAPEQNRSPGILGDYSTGISGGPQHGNLNHIFLHPVSKKNGGGHANCGRGNIMQHLSGAVKHKGKRRQKAQHKQGVFSRQTEPRCGQIGTEPGKGHHPLEPDAQSKADPMIHGVKNRQSGEQQRQQSHMKCRSKHPDNQKIGKYRHAAGGHIMCQQDRKCGQRGETRSLHCFQQTKQHRQNF